MCAKFHDYRTLNSGEEILRSFTIHGHYSYLGHVTQTILINSKEAQQNLVWFASGSKEDV